MAFARTSGHQQRVVTGGLLAAGVVGLGLACGSPVGDTPVGAGRSADPCASGPKLEVVELPATYAVQLGERELGKLDVSDEHGPRLVAVTGAPAESVAAFEALLDAAAGQPSVEFTWSKETRKGETYGCAREVSKEEPGYVSALARHLEGKRIEGSIVHLRLE